MNTPERDMLESMVGKPGATESAEQSERGKLLIARAYERHVSGESRCIRAPSGWQCTRASGHGGLCTVAPAQGEPLTDELRDAAGALRFILAFYEPRQTYLDTNAWKQAEATGRAALKRADAALSQGEPHAGSAEPWAVRETLTEREIADLAAEDCEVTKNSQNQLFYEFDGHGLLRFARALSAKEQTKGPGDPAALSSPQPKAEPTAIDYFVIHEYAERTSNGADYNALCGMVRAALSSPSAPPGEDQAREWFNDWYEKQPMPQLLARIDPQQAAHNAFEFGRSIAALARPSSLGEQREPRVQVDPAVQASEEKK